MASGVCDVCPRTCPMHAHGRARGPGADARGCHHAPPSARSATGAADRHDCGPGVGLARPGCRPHHQLPAVAIADALLPASPRITIAAPPAQLRV